MCSWRRAGWCRNVLCGGLDVIIRRPAVFDVLLVTASLLPDFILCAWLISDQPTRIFCLRADCPHWDVLWWLSSLLLWRWWRPWDHSGERLHLCIRDAWVVQTGTDPVQARRHDIRCIPLNSKSVRTSGIWSHFEIFMQQNGAFYLFKQIWKVWHTF